MAIHPGDRIHIDPEEVIRDRDGLYEPFLIVERAMRNSHMKNIRQIHPGKKPTTDKINPADQQSSPRSQLSRGEVRTSQHVNQNKQIAGDVVDFHDGSPWRNSNILSNNNLSCPRTANASARRVSSRACLPAAGRRSEGSAFCSCPNVEAALRGHPSSTGTLACARVFANIPVLTILFRAAS